MEDKKIFYLCDRKACTIPCVEACKHTSDITHAKNFEFFEEEGYFEKNECGPTQEKSSEELFMTYRLDKMSAKELYEVLIKEVKFNDLIAVLYELNQDMKRALGDKK